MEGQYSKFLPQGPLTGLSGHATYIYDQDWQATNTLVYIHMFWPFGLSNPCELRKEENWSVCREHTHSTQKWQAPKIQKQELFFFLSFCFCHSASTLIAFNSSSHLCSFRWTNYVNLPSKKFALNGKMVQFKWFSFPGPSSFQTVPNNSFTIWISGVFCS